MVGEALMYRLMHLAGWRLCLKYPNKVKTYMDDLKIDHHKSVKKSILDYNFLVHKEYRPHFAALLIFPDEGFDIPIPRNGCLPLPYAYEGAYLSMREVISRMLCLGEEAFLLGLQFFHQNLDISNVTLINPRLYSLPRPFNVEDFRIIQEDYIKEIAENFKHEWIPRVVGILDELAPPSLELTVTCMERLNKYLRRLSLTMAEQLEVAVLRTIEVYQQLWEDYLPSEESEVLILQKKEAQETTGDASKHEVSESEPAFLSEKNQGALLMPMFKVKLVVEIDEFKFLPALEVVERTVLSVFDCVIGSVKGMEDIQSRLPTLSKILEPKDIRTVAAGDPRVLKARKIIQGVLQQSFLQLQELENSYQSFKELALINVDQFLEEYETASHSLEDYEGAITYYRQVAESAFWRSEREVIFRMFIVDCSTVREELYEKAVGIADKLACQILEASSLKSNKASEHYTAIETQLNGAITTPEELDKLRKYIASRRTDLAQLQEDINQSSQVWSMLDRNQFNIPEEDMEAFWDTMGWPQRIGLALEECESRLSQEKVKFTNQLALDQLNLKANIKALAEEVQEFMKLGDIDSFEERAVYVQEIEAKIRKCNELVELFSSREQVFGLMVTEHPQIELIDKEFEMYGVLWHTCSDFLRVLPQWMDGPFNFIVTEDIVQNVDKWFRSCSKSVKQVSGLHSNDFCFT
ncbi:hypothetical protein O6H91_09G011300 [Diphasiastrum complanatum]|uniref:Uncharacterized protein n=1 Tax=Diphasiastrum complanatum TaxID=34168 RepID=A0ACC2CM46_DIPCM|nr:hypothetical protein O6H91_09G011300 [Diphasiastrum complanatum]